MLIACLSKYSLFINLISNLAREEKLPTYNTNGIKNMKDRSTWRRRNQKTRDIIKTKLEMWGVGSNFGMERFWHGWCGEKESSEHDLECKKVKEIVERNHKKNGW